MRRLQSLLLFAGLVGPLIGAYAIAPTGVLAAWPVWSMSFVPALLLIVSGTVFRAYRPLIEAPLPATAGAWAQATLTRLGKVGITVATMDGPGGNFYHPASRTIVLSESVHGEHTARAYATAAHELGHAAFHTERPWLSRVLLAARGPAGLAYYFGVALLFGTVIAGEPSLHAVGFGLIALAAVLHALVVVDEAIASAIAGDLLREHLADAEQAGIARGHLRRAFATYASMLVAYLVPLAVAPWLLADRGGAVPPGPALGGSVDTIAHAGAWLVLVGAAGAVLVILSLQRGWFGLLALFPAWCWTPLLTVLLLDQPDLPRWTVALAVVPAWCIMMLPALVIVQWFGGKLAADVEMLPMPVPTTIRRVARKDLAGDDPAPDPLRRAVAFSFGFWAVPLALAWLGLV